MRGTTVVVIPPDEEPVSLALALQHCRIDSPGGDPLVAGYALVARVMAEKYLGRPLITQTLQWTAVPDNQLYPASHHLRRPIELPTGSVQSIESVTVLDTRGNSTVIAPAVLPLIPPETLQGYIADLAVTPAALAIGRGTVLVDGRYLFGAAIRHLQVRFVAGYGEAADVPLPIGQAILLTTAFLYENRGDVGAAMPQAAEWLLDPYRIVGFG